MLRVYNNLSRKKDILRPRVDKKVQIFVCGPTVYDFSHIGHARTYLIFDMITKYLRELKAKVFYLQNITDIDDKIIQRAREKKTTPKKLARRFEKEYLRDMKNLKVDSVTRYARATNHIKEIVSQVGRLLKKGFAYRIDDGIYYDISKFKDYGKLSKRTALQAEDAVSRIDESKGKRNKGDFCLWKISKLGEPSWKSHWGLGRPGWHIEDTAITEKYFGPHYDIHGGGRDLIFPHHEAEIAQMEAISGRKPMVRYWLHTGFLTVDGQKMAKSLGNFITIRDFVKRYSARALRFFVLKNHYRSPIDYTGDSVVQAQRELERIDEFVGKIRNSKFEIRNPDFIIEDPRRSRDKSKIQISKFKNDFNRAMEDDFNTPKAVAAIFGLIGRGNSVMDKNLLSRNDAKDVLGFFRKVDKFFNFIFREKSKEKIPEKLSRLAGQRQKYRKEKDWQKADEIRREIKELGWWVEDTKKGHKLKKIL